MRKNNFYSKLKIALVLISGNCLLNITVHAQEIQGYDFPVKPGTEQWKAFTSHEEMVQACTIPSGVLIGMSTDALINTCLSYPLYADIFNFDNIQQGFVKIKNDFNGFSELFARKDAGSQLVKLYQHTRPEGVKEDSQPLEKGKYIYSITFIEMLLAQYEIIASLSIGEKAVLMNLALDADKAKEGLPHIYGYSCRISNSLIAAQLMKVQHYMPFTTEMVADKKIVYFMEMGNIPEEVSFLDNISRMANEFAGRTVEIVYNKTEACSTVQTVKTPKNSTVSCDYYTCEPMSIYQLMAGEQYNTQNYPNAIKLASGTGKYNCHSFSWYAQDSTNVRWIYHPQAYWKDGSYVEVTPNKGSMYRWTYSDNKDTLEHTAIEIVNKGLPLTSKWGANPLYAHDYKYVPYTTTNMKSYKLNTPTGINSVSSGVQKKIILAPNPTSGNFTVSISGNTLLTSILVYNISGQIVYSDLFSGNKAQVDLSDYPKGIYTLNVFNDNLVEVDKLIVE